MKPIKVILTIGCFLILSPSLHSQIFKKLKEKVKNAVEDAVVQKTAEKAAEESEGALDKLFNMKLSKDPEIYNEELIDSINARNTPYQKVNMSGGTNGSGDTNGNNINYPINPGNSKMKPDLSNMPKSYGFEWIYEMNILYASKSELSGDIDLTFYFKNDADYYGFKTKIGPVQNIFMISDKSMGQTLQFLEQDNQKYVFSTFNKAESDNSEIENYTITKLDERSILGYKCEGYKLDGDKYEMNFYVTFETSVGFSDLYGDNKYFPKNFDPAWNPDGDKEGVIMKMTMKEKKTGNVMEMNCTGFEEHSFDFDTTGYSTIFQKQ